MEETLWRYFYLVDSISDEKLTDHLETVLSSIPETIDLEELVSFLQIDVIPRLSTQVQL